MSDAVNTPAAVSEPPPGPSPGAANGADPYPMGSNVPRAVREQRRRADELQAQLIAAVEADERAQQDELNEPASPPPMGEAMPAPVPPVQPQDDWQHRYRTLQGKYDAEIPALRGQISHLENLIATMSVAPRAEPSPTPPPTIDLNTEIPEEDYTTYGSDFVDSTRRWARAELAPVVKDLRRQIDELHQQQSASSGDRVKDRVRQMLDRDPELTGRWEPLDTDPGFNQWLQEVDHFSGARRLDMLRHAYANGDATRTGNFFKAYLREHTDYRQLPPPSPAQTAPQGNAGGMDLAAFAAPGRAANATPGGNGAPDRRIWTNREIQAFYADRVRGRFRGREAEADRLERDILAAASEGRVRNA